MTASAFADTEPGLATEEAESRWFDENIGQYDAFFDVGANFGLYSSKADARMQNGQIIAVEANPEIVHQMEQKVRAALLPDNGNRFEVLHCAASDRQGTITFNIAGADTLGSIVQKADDTHRVDVPARSLDDILETSGVDLEKSRVLIKVDVEGAEYRVVRGAEGLLGKANIDFFVEMHSWGDKEIGRYPKDVLKIFQDKGYRFRRVGSLFLFSLETSEVVDRDYAKWIGFYALKQLPYSHFSFVVPAIRFLKSKGLWVRT